MRSLGMLPIVLIIYSPSLGTMIGRYAVDDEDCANDVQKELMASVRSWSDVRAGDYMGLHQDYFAKSDIRNLKQYGFGRDFNV